MRDVIQDVTPQFDEPGFDEEHFAWVTVGLVIEHLDHNGDCWSDTAAGLVCPIDDTLVVPSPAFLAAGGMWPPVA